MIGQTPQKCARCGKKLVDEEIEYISIDYEFGNGFTHFLCKEHRDKLLALIKDFVRGK